MVRYTEQKLSKTLESIEQLLELDAKKRGKILEIRKTLTRTRRAIDKTFWLDKIEWKKKPYKDKLKLIREERCVHFQSSGSPFQDVKDFEWFAKKQWEKDRALLIKRGEITG